MFFNLSFSVLKVSCTDGDRKRLFCKENKKIKGTCLIMFFRKKCWESFVLFYLAKLHMSYWRGSISLCSSYHIQYYIITFVMTMFCYKDFLSYFVVEVCVLQLIQVSTKLFCTAIFCWSYSITRINVKWYNAPYLIQKTWERTVFPRNK